MGMVDQPRSSGSSPLNVHDCGWAEPLMVECNLNGMQFSQTATTTRLHNISDKEKPE